MPKELTLCCGYATSQSQLPSGKAPKSVVALDMFPAIYNGATTPKSIFAIVSYRCTDYRNRRIDGRFLSLGNIEGFLTYTLVKVTVAPTLAVV